MNQMAREIYGIEMNPGPFGMNSRPALIGVKVAETAGMGEQFHDRVMAAYWQEAQNIEDRATLTQLAAEVGLEPAFFAAGLDDPHYNELVDDDVQNAARYGLTGVPAMIFANKYLISGAQPPDQLREIADKVLALQQEAAAP